MHRNSSIPGFPPGWGPGPIMQRIEGSYRQGSMPETFTFPPDGMLEGLELWLPDPIPAVNAQTLIEARIDLRIDNRNVGNLRAFSVVRCFEPSKG